MTSPEASPSPRLRPPTPRVALLIGAAVVVGVLLYLARGSLGPFVVGLALIYVMDPGVERLTRASFFGRRIPRGLAVLVIYIVVIVAMAWGLSVLVGPLVGQISTFVEDFPAFQANLATWYQGLELPAFLRSAIDGLVTGLDDAAGGVGIGQLLPFARSVVGYLASFLGYLIIPIWAFYLLKDRPTITAGINDAIPPTWRRDLWACVGIVNRVFGRWLRAQLLLGLVVGAATFLGLEILGWTVDPRFAAFAILLAVIAGIFELLPIIGPILSMIPTLVVALTIADPLRGIIAVVILYLVVQQLENNILVPLVQGDAIDLHPSVVILALIVGGAIAGLMGAIFALPLTAAGRDVYRYAFRRLSTDDPNVRAADDLDLLPFRDRLPDASGNFPEPDEILAEDDDPIAGPAGADQGTVSPGSAGPGSAGVEPRP